MDGHTELTALWHRLSKAVQESILTLAYASVEPATRCKADYLSVCQVAAKMGKRPATIRKWIATRELKAVNLGTKLRPRMKVRPVWIEDFERSRMPQEPTAVCRRKIAKPAVEYV